MKNKKPCGFHNNPEVNIVYHFESNDIKVYWVFDKLKIGIADENIDIVFENLQKERKFINEVL